MDDQFENVSVADALRERKQLETRIAQALQEFSDETGLTVRHLNVVAHRTHGGAVGPYAVGVEVEL